MPLGHNEVGARRSRGWIDDAVRASGLGDQAPTRVGRAKRTAHWRGTLTLVDVAVSVDLAVAVAEDRGIWQDNVTLVYLAPMSGVGPETTSLDIPPHREVGASVGLQQLGYGHQYVGLLLWQQHVHNVVADNRVVPSCGFRRVVVRIETNRVDAPGAQKRNIRTGSAPEIEYPASQEPSSEQQAGWEGRSDPVFSGQVAVRVAGRTINQLVSQLLAPESGPRSRREMVSSECVGGTRIVCVKRQSLRLRPLPAELDRCNFASLYNANEKAPLPARR